MGGLFLQCKDRQVIYSGTFEGEPYELISVETKGFSTNSIDYVIKSERMRSLEIDATTTDWGPPYADDLYGNTPRAYLTNGPSRYRNEPDNAVQHPSTMVYLSPKHFSRAAFDLYTRFMKSEWPKIDRKFGHEEYSHFPHIIGLVYGKQADFTRTFQGRKDRTDYIIRVEVDGRIRYGSPDLSFEEYSGLSEKVQMPGKRIYVSPAPNAGTVYGGVSMAQLKTYRDAAGKTPGDYFTLIEKP